MLTRLIKVLATRPFDVVHTHQHKDTVLGAIAARLTGVPNVVRTVHGHPEPAEGWPALKIGIYEWLDRIALRRSGVGHRRRLEEPRGFAAAVRLLARHGHGDPQRHGADSARAGRGPGGDPQLSSRFLPMRSSSARSAVSSRSRDTSI